jgi:hypothetical protein
MKVVLDPDVPPDELRFVHPDGRTDRVIIEGSTIHWMVDLTEGHDGVWRSDP